ncbi:Alg9-like mannosyltransferase family-domain-containing protein [Apodospora peruviana]|uniref:Mannosyltransferase n=1 Tax=Apodospora peruviana TaxID=516989 RepID=A0AAE0MEY6_9PEZI|nr:Alg9-like mannosyltransferase family-domain-containing protein [Apodospora peruviana]
MKSLADIAFSLLIPGLILLHLIVAPYTKVEESFNIQAAHDVLVYGTPTSDISRKLQSSYDHFTFPGAVPRTFIGSVLLAGISQPIINLVGFHHGQFVVRAVLGLFNAGCLLCFARNIKRTYGTATARWYLLLQASQFHVIFYASRTLPNMFAFGLTTLAFAFLIPHPDRKRILPRQRLAVTLFVFAAAVFRSEVALLLGTIILYLLILPATSLETVIPPFIVSFLMALAISVPVDSYFWQKPVWPELWGFYYNAIQGSSSDWGVSPWSYYFVSALPRLLLNPFSYLVLLPLSLSHPALKPATRRLAVPSLLFVAIYSLQPHKEARFIFYVVPPLTAASAMGANLLFNRAFPTGTTKPGKMWSSFLAMVLVISVLVSFATSSAMLLISSLNYPGGEALSYLRDTVLQSEGVSSISSSSSSASPALLVPAHADVLACMTGVTLFGTATSAIIPNHHTGGGGNNKLLVGEDLGVSSSSGGGGGGGGSIVTIALDKTEDESVLGQPDFWTRFDYALTENPDKVKKGSLGEVWEVIGIVKGYAGIEVVGLPLPGHRASRESTQDGEEHDDAVVGRGVTVERWKRGVMALTGGRWVGPRMVPRIYILKRVKKEGRKRSRQAVEA